MLSEVLSLSLLPDSWLFIAGWFVSDAYCTFGNWQSSTIYEIFMLQRDAEKKTYSNPVGAVYPCYIIFTRDITSKYVSMECLFVWVLHYTTFSNFTHYIAVLPQTSMVTSPTPPRPTFHGARKNPEYQKTPKTQVNGVRWDSVPFNFWWIRGL